MNILDPKSVEESIVKVLKIFKEVKSISESEVNFHNQWLDLGRQLFESNIQYQIEDCEKVLTGAHQKYAKSYHTRLGTIRLIRKSYINTEGGYVCHADSFLSLPSNGWLASVQKLACTFGLETDFENAASILDETTRVKVTGNTMMQVVENLGHQLIEKQNQTQIVETAIRDSALFKTVCRKLKQKQKPNVYVGMDGLMLSMNRKQGYKEALVGVVFWQNAHMPVSKKRNEVRSRHYVAMMDTKDKFCESVFKSYAYLVGKTPCQVVILGDGARWIWDRASEHYPDGIQILDFYHVSEYVWAAAKEIYPQDKKKRKAWARRHLKSLKASKIHNFLKVLGKHPTIEGGLKTAVGTLKTYLLNNLERIDYARYMKLGLMIGSGVVESSNRRVVSQRLKRSGMHWSKEGANSIMALRAAYLSSDTQWNDFWEQKYVA